VWDIFLVVLGAVLVILVSFLLGPDRYATHPILHQIKTPSIELNLSLPVGIVIKGNDKESCNSNQTVLTVYTINRLNERLLLLLSTNHYTCFSFVVPPVNNTNSFNVPWSRGLCGTVKWSVAIGIPINITVGNVTSYFYNASVSQQSDKTYLIQLKFSTNITSLLLNATHGTECFIGSQAIPKSILYLDKNMSSFYVALVKPTNTVDIVCKKKPTALRGFLIIAYTDIYTQRYDCNCSIASYNYGIAPLHYCILSSYKKFG